MCHPHESDILCILEPKDLWIYPQNLPLASLVQHKEVYRQRCPLLVSIHPTILCLPPWDSQTKKPHRWILNPIYPIYWNIPQTILPHSQSIWLPRSQSINSSLNVCYLQSSDRDLHQLICSEVSGLYGWSSSNACVRGLGPAKQNRSGRVCPGYANFLIVLKENIRNH